MALAKAANAPCRGICARPDGDAGTGHRRGVKPPPSLRYSRSFAEVGQQVASIDTLSMWACRTIEIAVASGSTMVRVGTAFVLRQGR